MLYAREPFGRAHDVATDRENMMDMEEVNMLQPDVISNLEQMAEFIFVPSDEVEFEQLVALLDEVTDIVRDDENHPLLIAIN